jgi:putative membrane protein
MQFSVIPAKTWVAAALLALVAATAPEVHAQAASAPPDAASPAAKPGTSSLARADRRFIEKAAQGGVEEVELATLAQQRAASEPVKQFAARMVEDHGKTNEELRQLAAARSLQWPAGVDRAGQREVQHLGTLSGADFDRSYMRMMVADHRKTVANFQQAAKSAQDAEVKAFASRTLPTLQAHLEQAQRVHDGLPGRAGGAASAASR